MLSGVLALLERGLRIDVRDRWSHGLRVSAVLVAYAGLVQAQEQSRYIGAPGLAFFQTFVSLNALFIAVAGVGFFSSVITEEREEGTLGLMLMTGLGPLGILVGKFGGRLIQAFLLILLQVPMTLLAITLGGITLSQIGAAVAAILSFLFLVANVALLVSVLSRNSRQAAFRMTLVAIGYCVLAWVAYELLTLFQRGGMATGGWVTQMLRGILDSLIFARISSALSSAASATLITSHEILAVITGCCCFLLSWGLFGWATRQPDTEAVTRGWAGFTLGNRLRIAPGRCWSDPGALAWKEFHFLVGGWPKLAGKSVFYALFLGGLWWYWNVLHGQRSGTFPGNYSPFVEAAIPLLCFAMTIEAATLGSRVFQDELRAKTWSTLTTIPKAMPWIAYGKVLAALVGLIPVIGFELMIQFGTHRGRAVLGEIMDEPMFWGICAVFFAAVHVATLLSLYIRWGAVPLALVGTYLSVMLLALFCQLAGLGPGEDQLAIVLLFFAGCVCLATHALVGHKLAILATE